MGSLAQEASSCKSCLPCISCLPGRLAACTRRPVQTGGRLKLQVRGTSTPWRLSTPPGDDASEDLISQVSLAVAVIASTSCKAVQAAVPPRNRHVFQACLSGIIAQVDQTKTPGQSSGQRPEPLAGPDPQQPPPGLRGRVKRFFLGDKMDAQRLKALGMCPLHHLSPAAIHAKSYMACASFQLLRYRKQRLFCTRERYAVTPHTTSHIGRGCQCEDRVHSGHALQFSLLLSALTGLGAVASYGAISNVTYGGGLAVAWIAFVRQFNKSPLMPGQWKAFVAFYAGDFIACSCSCSHMRMLAARFIPPAHYADCGSDGHVPDWCSMLLPIGSKAESGDE